MPETTSVLLGALPAAFPPTYGHWASGSSLGRVGEATQRAPLQELQQKRAQKSGDAELGLLKGTRDPGKVRPAQELPLRPGGMPLQTRKANSTGEWGTQRLHGRTLFPPPLGGLWPLLLPRWCPLSLVRRGLGCAADPQALHLWPCPTSSGAGHGALRARLPGLSPGSSGFPSVPSVP